MSTLSICHQCKASWEPPSCLMLQIAAVGQSKCKEKQHKSKSSVLPIPKWIIQHVPHDIQRFTFYSGQTFTPTDTLKGLGWEENTVPLYPHFILKINAVLIWLHCVPAICDSDRKRTFKADTQTKLENKWNRPCSEFRFGLNENEDDVWWWTLPSIVGFVSWWPIQ